MHENRSVYVISAKPCGSFGDQKYKLVDSFISLVSQARDIPKYICRTVKMIREPSRMPLAFIHSLPIASAAYFNAGWTQRGSWNWTGK